MGAANGAEAAPAVGHGRDGGLVVIDTAAATPRDPATVDALAAELRVAERSTRSTSRSRPRSASTPPVS